MRAHYNGLRRDDAPIAVFSADHAEAPNSYDAWQSLPEALEKQGVSLEDDGIDQVEPYFNYGAGPFDNAGIGLDAEIILPQAIRQVSTADNGKACIVLAATPDILPVAIPDGLSPDMAARYINRHEFWHCLDDTMPDQHMSPQAEASGLDAAGYAFLQNVLRTEIFADLNAVADLIALDRAPRSTIDSIARWRTDALASMFDLGHYTAPALQALGREIDRMGLEKFRRLSDGQRGRLTQRAAAAHTPSAAAMALGMNLIAGMDMPEEFTPSDADHAYARHMEESFKAAATKAPPAPAIAPHKAEIEPFDAAAALSAAAGTSTPTRLQLLAARADLLDGFRRDINADPANPVHASKILRLGQAYQALLYPSAAAGAVAADAAPAAGKPAAPFAGS